MRRYPELPFFFTLLILILFLSCRDKRNDPRADSSAGWDSLSTSEYDSILPSAVKSDDYEYNFPADLNDILGCWAAIRAQNITISFEKDSSFEFYDFNSKTNETELLMGKFELKDTLLILHYDDRPGQKFHFGREDNDPRNFYISKDPGYYFVKSDCP